MFPQHNRGKNRSEKKVKVYLNTPETAKCRNNKNTAMRKTSSPIVKKYAIPKTQNKDYDDQFICNLCFPNVTNIILSQKICTCFCVFNKFLNKT